MLVINLTIAVIAFLILAWFRYRKQRSRQRSRHHEDVEDTGPSDVSRSGDGGRVSGESYLGWVWPLIRMSDNEVAAKCGNDAVLYLAFQKAAVAFLLVMLVFGLGLLVPLNATGGHRLKGFPATTVSNVAEVQRYWGHALTTVLFSILIYFFVYRLRRLLLRRRREFHLNKSEVALHTVMIKGFPATSLDPQPIRDHFEQLLGSAQVQRWLKRRKSKKARRRQVETQEAASRPPTGGVDDDDGDGGGDGVRLASPGSGVLDLPLLFSFLPPAPGPGDSSHREWTGEGSYFSGRARGHTPRDVWNESSISSCWNDCESTPRRRSHQVIAVQVAYEVGVLEAAVQEYRVARGRLRYFQRIRARTGRAPLIRPGWSGALPCLRKAINAVDHYEACVEAAANRVREEHHLARHRRATGVVFVTFRTEEQAKAVIKLYRRYTHPFTWALRVLQDITGMDNILGITAPEETTEGGLTPFSTLLQDKWWTVRPAPEPDDIQWANLGVGVWEHRLKTWYITALLLIFLTFWTTPVAIWSAIQPLSDAFNSGIARFFVDVQGSGVLTAYIPSLTMVVITIVLPLLIWLAGMLEGADSMSEQHRSIAVKTYFYLLFEVLILPSLYLTSIDALIESTWANRYRIASIWDGVFLPDSGAFFINYIVQMGLLSTVVESLRISERLTQWWKKMNAVTDEERTEAESFAYIHEYGMQYAFLLAVFAAVLTYSTTTPLIIPAGLIYFLCKHFLDKYHLVHIRPRTYESDGRLIWTVLKAIVLTATIFQFFVSMFLLLHGTIMQFVVVILLPGCSVLIVVFNWVSGSGLFKFSSKSRYRKIRKHLYAYVEVAYQNELLKDSIIEEVNADPIMEQRGGSAIRKPT